MNFSKHILKNGTRVVLVPMKDTQTVTILILVEAGSKYETKNNNGISHFIEHMMFKGTKKHPTAKSLTELFDNVGGEYNAFTGKEQTGYFIKVPKQHFEMALEVVCDLYLNSLLKSVEINKERGVILQEAAMYRDTPTRYVWDIFEGLMYGDQPAGWDIIGTDENIKGFNRKFFIDYMQKMYLAKSTVVSIAGNVEEGRALELTEKYFRTDGSRKKKTTKKKVKEQQNVPKIRLYPKKTDQTHLMLGFRGPHMFSPDRHAAVVLGTVLGGGFSSRAFINIREKHGLTYYIESATEMMTDSGFIFMRAGVQHENLLKATRLILEEFKKIRDKKVSQKELKKAKEYLKGKTLMSLESTNAVASFFGDQELFRKKIKSPEELFEKIDAVTAEQIQKIVQKIVKNNKVNFAVIGPHKDEASLKKILRV